MPNCKKVVDSQAQKQRITDWITFIFFFSQTWQRNIP
jgi:hypothetical protein